MSTELRATSSSKVVLGTILVFGIIVFVALGVRFDLGVVPRAFMALVSGAILFLAYRKSLYPFFLALLTGTSVYIALIIIIASGRPMSAPRPLLYTWS